MKCNIEKLILQGFFGYSKCNEVMKGLGSQISMKQPVSILNTSF